MIIRIFILCVTVFWLFSCAEKPQYGSGPDNSCASNKEYAGGVSCNSKTNRDQSFLDFLSDKSDSNGVGDINCEPDNTGGVYFNMQVTLNAPFDPRGNNNNLIMQPGSSSLKIGIYDTRAFNKTDQPIIIEFTGSSGDVNDDKANLSFIYNKEGVHKKITMNGTFDANTFYGTMSFENSAHLSGGRPASGPFGKFSIPTCAVFTSN